MPSKPAPQPDDLGSGHTADEMLPGVYEQLRRLAARMIARERPGQTLQPTALVHEAFLRLQASMGDPQTADGTAVACASPRWASRQHFFLVAAETMRRILIDAARRKHADKRGGDRERIPLELDQIAEACPPGGALVMEEAIARLAASDPNAGKLVQLYYLSGMTVAEAAATLDLPLRTAERLLAFARAWLVRELVL